MNHFPSIPILLILFFFIFTNPTSSTIDHFLKLNPQNTATSEYIELTPPLPTSLLTPTCTTHLLQQDFAHTINSPPITTNYTPPPLQCLWTNAILEFSASCKGDQYDRIAGVWLDGVEILRTSTAEPTEAGVYWRVQKDITRYKSLLNGNDSRLSVMLENVVNDVYTGVYHVNISVSYYYNGGEAPAPAPGPAQGPQSSSAIQIYTKNELRLKLVYEKPADMIIPISESDDQAGYWYRIQSEKDVKFKEILIPGNTHKAVLDIYVSFHGNDEFWYSNPPDSYIKLNNLTTTRGNGAFRYVFVTIDGVYAGSILPFPVIFTGGINPLFWEPVVAIGAFDLPCYQLDFSPFLGLLLDGKPHVIGIGVSESISFWLVDANLHLWLDSGSSTVLASSVISPVPEIEIKRKSKFKYLDGKFKIKAKRETEFCGWVNSSLGNLTTCVSQEFKFKNKIKFKNLGQHKEVEQKIKAETQVKVVSSDTGVVLAQSTIKSKFPLHVITSTTPGVENNTYVLTTNVSHAFEQTSFAVFPSGNFSSSINNKQVSGGWMLIQDHSVLSGNATTNQTLSYNDDNGCYSRTVAVSDGKFLEDNSTVACITSMSSL
ncbi:hypothetical protein ACHQM5_008630 [Ranunculus cassubicifolius]